MSEVVENKAADDEVNLETEKIRQEALNESERIQKRFEKNSARIAEQLAASITKILKEKD